MKYLLFVLLTFLFTGAGHPFYQSVTDLKFNAKEKRIQGFVKIFTNDFEWTLKKTAGSPVDLLNGKDTNLVLRKIGSYITAHLDIKINGQSIKYSTIGYENDDGATFVYVESEKCMVPLQIALVNSLLCGYFKEQTNIIHVEVNGAKKSTKLTCPNNETQFRF
jgi:hypothetical protein